jgi:hypothetical protein
MRMRSLMLTAVTAGMFHSAAATADVEIIVIEADGQTPPTIEVGGPHRDAYREVLTETMTFRLRARGAVPNSSADSTVNFTIDAIEGDAWVRKYEGRLYEVWRKYSIPVQYSDVSISFGQDHLAPIRRCNKLLEKTSGAAREDFLFKGGTISLDDVFTFRGRRTSPDHATRTTRVPVTIKCLPLDQDPLRAKLRIEPAKVEKVGKYLCPMELKLHGLIESREKFRGKALFVGPHYLSAITDLNFTKAGNRNMTATYKIKWKSKAGGFTTAPSGAPGKQDLTFRFNVADRNGKLLESSQERVEVSCRKIRVAAPTSGSDMTVSPAN